VPLHPTQLYEVVVEVLIFAICFAIWSRNPRPWSIAAVWLGLYGTLRFFLEFVRADYRGGVLLSTSQWISLGMIVVAIVLVFGVLRGRLAVDSPKRAHSQ
jgi:phosphatidylglycerol:prolipoprotein diacylglycerol transferase